MDSAGPDLAVAKRSERGPNMNPEHSPDEPALTWTSAPSILFDAPGLTILTYQCAAWSVVRVEGELDLRGDPRSTKRSAPSRRTSCSTLAT